MERLDFPVGNAHIRFVVDGDTVGAEWIPSPLAAARGRQARRARASAAPKASASAHAHLITQLVNAWMRGQPISPARVSTLMPTRPEFFVACWKACLRIPRGETRSYAWLAKAAGRPAAVRAAAQAMARNPLPLIVPCHRVTGTNDGGGFCGFGHMGDRSPRARRFLALKEALLEMERPTSGRT